MSQLPANFFTRQELQRLISRADDLLRSTHLSTELRSSLTHLLNGTARLDGLLAELPITNHPNDRALINCFGWQSLWREAGSWIDHAHGFRFSCWQQFLERLHNPAIATGRWRVRLGEDEHTSSDRRMLINLTICYVTKFRDQVTQDVRDRCVDHLLGCPED